MEAINQLDVALFSISGLVVCVTSTLLALILLIYGKLRLHKVFALFNFAIALWGICAFFIGRSHNPNQVLLLFKIGQVGIVFIAVFFYHFCCLLSSINRKSVIIFAYLQAVIFSFLSFNSFGIPFISHVERMKGTFYYLKSNGFLYPLFLTIWILLVLLALIETYKKFRIEENGIKRNQLLYILIWFGIGFTGGISNFLPAFNVQFVPLGNFTIPIYCLVSTYAILRYNLLDVKIAVTRLAVFIIVYVSVLALPCYLYAMGIKFIAFISGIISASAGPFLYIFLQRRVENRLLQEENRVKDVFLAMSIGLNAVKELSKVLDTIIKVATANLVNHVSIYLFNSLEDRYVLSIAESQEIKEVAFDKDCPFLTRLKERNYPILCEEMKHVSENKNEKINGVERIVLKMQELSAAVVVPLIREKNLMGFITFGERTEKRPYSKSMTDMLAIAASHVSLAIENALYYEAEKKQIEEDSKRARIESLDMLANTMAHEIDNPMNIVINNANEISEIIKGVVLKTYFDAIFGKGRGDEIINELIKNDIIEEVSEEGKCLVKYKLAEVSGHGTKILYDLIRNEVVEDINPTDVQVKPHLDQKEALVKEIAKEDFDKVWKLLKARTEVRVKQNLDEKKEVIRQITQGSFETVWLKLKECQKAVEGVAPDLREKLQRQCNEITISSFRVSAIVNSVETSGKQDKAPMGEVYINLMMISMDALLALYKKKYNTVQLIKEIEDDLPPIWGQTVLIDEIMQNFIKNGLMAASEKNPQRGGKVTLKIYRKQENLTADNIVIEVADNGVGMTEKIAKQVFYVPASNRGSAQGQGVGLVRVRKIVVDILKGTVKAESDGPGKGSRFIITLPVYKGGNSTPPKQTKKLF